MQHLHIATACFFNPEGALLTVQKRGTSTWMLPGGKRDGDETPLQALVRELQEELQLHVDVAQLTALGRFSAMAANEAATQVHADVFVAHDALTAPVQMAAEIAAVRWLPLDGTFPATLAPLLRDQVIPALRQRGAAQPHPISHP